MPKPMTPKQISNLTNSTTTKIKSKLLNIHTILDDRKNILAQLSAGQIKGILEIFLEENKLLDEASLKKMVTPFVIIAEIYNMKGGYKCIQNILYTLAPYDYKDPYNKCKTLIENIPVNHIKTMLSEAAYLPTTSWFKVLIKYITLDRINQTIDAIKSNDNIYIKDALILKIESELLEHSGENKEKGVSTSGNIDAPTADDIDNLS